MNPVIPFVIVMVLVGGFVAAAGDAIGRNLGKKRLRIGHLRPKHTAILGTFLAGMAGTAVTIVILATVSEPIKKWLLESEKTKVELADLKQQRDSAQETVGKTQKQLDGLKAELSGQAVKLVEEQGKVTDAKAESEKFKKDATAFKNRVDDVRKSLTTTSDQLKKTLVDLQKVCQETTDAKAEQNRISADNTKIQQKNQELTVLNEKLTNDLGSLQGQVTQLEASVKELNAAKIQLDKTYNERLASNQADLKRVKDQYDQAVSDLQTAKDNLDSVRALIQQLGNAQVNARTSPLIYNAGDELARTVIPPRSNEAEVRNLLLAALREAETGAKGKGAKTTATGGQTAGFVDIDRNGRTISVAEQEREVISQVANKNDQSVLVLDSAVNAFKGEFVWVIPSVRPNPVVFQANELVAEGQVDGRLSEAEVTKQVLDLVNTKVRDVALRRGMIPATGSEMPLGQVTIEQILAIVKQVRDSEKTVRVQFLAAQVTRAAEPLRLAHRLRL